MKNNTRSIGKKIAKLTKKIEKLQAKCPIETKKPSERFTFMSFKDLLVFMEDLVANELNASTKRIDNVIHFKLTGCQKFYIIVKIARPTNKKTYK